MQIYVENLPLSGSFSGQRTKRRPPPEWPSLCFDFDYHQNFGFVPSATESGVWPGCLWMRRGADLSRRGSGRCVIKNAPTVKKLTHLCPRVVVHGVKLSALSAVGSPEKYIALRFAMSRYTRDCGQASSWFYKGMGSFQKYILWTEQAGHSRLSYEL